MVVGDESTVRGKMLYKGVGFMVEDGRDVRFFRWMIGWGWALYM